MFHELACSNKLILLARELSIPRNLSLSIVVELQMKGLWDIFALLIGLQKKENNKSQ
jgi:hypothetical protein